MIDAQWQQQGTRVLNGLWLGFFLAAALAALSRWLVGGDPTVFAIRMPCSFASDTARATLLDSPEITICPGAFKFATSTSHSAANAAPTCDGVCGPSGRYHRTVQLSDPKIARVTSLGSAGVNSLDLMPAAMMLRMPRS